MRSVSVWTAALVMLQLTACSSSSGTPGAGGGAFGGGLGATGGGSSATGGGSAGGGSGTGGGSAIVPLSVDEYCAQQGVDTCAFLTACGFYEDIAHCQSFYSSIDYCQADRAALKDGRVTFDGTLARQCVDHVTAQTQCMPWSMTSLDCTKVFAGTVANGGSCFGSDECASGYCAHLASQCPGSCAPKGNAGDAVDSYDGCADGLYDYGGTCRAFAAAGSSCAPVSPVAYPQSCEAAYACDGAQCVPWRAQGMSCSTSTVCMYGECVNSVCVRYAHSNEPCNFGGVGHPHCSQDTVCTGADANGDGICTPPLGAGATCSYDWQCDAKQALICMPGSGTTRTCQTRLVSGAQCQYSWECGAGLQCSSTSQTCVARFGLGQSCAAASDGCLEDLWCDVSSNTTCVARKPGGSPCTSGNQCQTQYCPASGTCSFPACADPTP